jgi:hypothetical protein
VKLATALALAGAIVTASFAPGSATAAPEDEPSDRRLVAVGLALAIPTYFFGTVTHEGSHALAAEIVGGDTMYFRPWPGRDPYTKAWQLGLTRVSGLRGNGERLFFFMAPKIVDVALLGGYVALFESSAYPSSGYGQLVLTVLATGWWVDFAKDTLIFSKHNDLVKTMNILGMKTEWERLPLRLGFAAASAGLGYLVLRGHQRLFEVNNPPDEAAPLVLPVLTGAF